MTTHNDMMEQVLVILANRVLEEYPSDAADAMVQDVVEQLREAGLSDLSIRNMALLALARLGYAVTIIPQE